MHVSFSFSHETNLVGFGTRLFPCLAVILPFASGGFHCRSRDKHQPLPVDAPFVTVRAMSGGAEAPPARSLRIRSHVPVLPPAVAVAVAVVADRLQ